MGDIAAILIDESIVKIKNFNNPRYTLDGFLYGFTVNNVNYVHCVQSDAIKSNSEMFQQTIPKGYYDENKFLEYRNDKNKIKEFLESKYDANFSTATNGDIVHVKKIKLTSPYTNTDDFGFWLSYTLVYNGISLLSNNGSIINPSSNISEENMDLEQISKEFYNANIHYATKTGLSATEKYDRALIIAKIAIIINNITRTVFPLFTGETLLEQIKTSQKELWKTDVFTNPSQEDLQKYLNGISNFSRVGRLNKLKIELSSGAEKLYWLVIGMPISALSILTALSKLKLLEYLIRNVTIRQTYLLNNDNEALVLRIVKSVTESQSDVFLAGLIDDTKYSSLNNWSLFNRLLHDTDDSFIGIGDDNRKDLIMSLYLIWQYSSYNPYQNDSFSQTNLNKFIYNKKFGTNPDPSKPIFKTLMGIDPQKLDFSAAPITLNYISNSAFGFYFDNFDFYNTAPAVEGDSFEYDMRHFLNEHEYPKNKIIAIQDNYRASGEKGLYGTYDYYQPVSLVNTNQNAAISIPVVNGNNNSEDNNINSLIPIFVLKYIDGKNKESNFNTGIGYFIDIASLFIGGYGLATKIKHLRALSGFTEAILLGTETGSGTTFAVSMYVAAGAEAINFSAATISLFLKILTNPENENEPWLIDLKNKVMWLEILSGTGSVLAEGMIRKTSKNLVTEFNTNPKGWPKEFVNDARGIEARKVLEDASGISADLTNTLLKRLQQKVKNEIPERIKLENLRYERTNIITDTPINLETDKLPRFSKKKYSKVDDFKAKNTGLDLHSSSEIDELIELGFNSGLKEEEIKGLILKSYRTLKQADKTGVEDWINNYAIFLKPTSKGGRGKIAYCFHNLAHYEAFKLEFKSKILDKFYLTKYGDLTMSGSVLTKTLPPDLDLVMYMKNENIYELYNHYKETAKIAFEKGIISKQKYKNYIKGTDNYYNKTGRIHKSYYIAIDEVNNKLLSLEEELLKLDIIGTLNLSKTKLKDKFDFNIFSTSETGRSIPPELTIKF